MQIWEQIWFKYWVGCDKVWFQCYIMIYFYGITFFDGVWRHNYGLEMSNFGFASSDYMCRSYVVYSKFLCKRYSLMMVSSFKVFLTQLSPFWRFSSTWCGYVTCAGKTSAQQLIWCLNPGGATFFMLHLFICMKWLPFFRNSL